MHKIFPSSISLTVVSLLWLLGGNATAQNNDATFETAKSISLFNSVLKELNTLYVDTFSLDKMVEKGINSMLYTLDPYTTYIPETETDDFKFITTGEYGGIGSLITSRDSFTYIAEPYEGLPAQIHGLKAGDKILRIDSVSAIGMPSDKVSELLKGPANTVVTVVIERPETFDTLTFNIVRKKIALPAVPYYGVCANDIGYIYLQSFTDKAATEVKEAFLDLKKNQHISSLIIDLRSNPGGILDEALQIINYFVPKGTEILSTRGRISQWDKTYKTLQKPLDDKIPLVILINNESASASEIVSGTLQDLDRAVIIGERSFGKGLVQTTRPLPYNGMIKVTTSKYYIPSGRSIQAIDYSHRNTDGRAERIPDSLTTVYNTIGGRTVRDGGGITPDIQIELPQTPNIVFYLVNDMYTFQYATRYAQQHDTIASIEDFTITDEIYDDFKEYVKEKGFTYDNRSGNVLEELRKWADFEGYLDDIRPEIDTLSKKLSHNLDHDFATFREEIAEQLSFEIVKRYYYQKGEIRESLKNDSIVTRAEEILLDPKQYQEILRPIEKKNKK
ncbi:MAG: S41 family peptidase [Porphyromonadaceae bacterium]|nr:S41 family peptidase [Porphyromonadaceae bacterium]